MTLQIVAVDAIVACAAGYAAWRLSPLALRRWCAARLAALLRRGGIAQATTARIEKSAAASGCGGCDSCGGCPPVRSDANAERVIAVERAK